VKLERVRLERVPGIDPAFTIEDLVPGINVVVGPNGSGKTSFRKAVAATLWPSAHYSKQLEVKSEWKDGERRLDAQRDGGTVTWTIDDTSADAPALPPAHLEHCYTLGVSELLLSDNTADQAIAKQIRVAMSGGYDLGEVGSTHFELKSHFGRHERNEFETAQHAYKNVCRDQRDLGVDQDRLEELRAEAEAAKAAERLIPRIKGALKLQTMSRMVSSRQEAIDLYPAVIANISAQDAELLDEFIKGRKDAVSKVETLEDMIGGLKCSIADSGLGEQVPAQEDLDAASARIAGIVRSEDALAGARTRHRTEVAKVEAAKQLLAGGVAGDAVPDISIAALNRSEILMRRRESDRAIRKALEQEIAALGGRKTDGDARTLEAASALLRDWLATPVGVAQAVPVSMAPVVITCFIALMGVGLAFFFHLYWLLAAGAGIGAAGGFLLASRRSVEANSGVAERDRHAQRFTELKVGSPAAWSSEQVRALLRELDGRHSDAVLGSAAEEQRKLLEKKLSKHGVDESATNVERQNLLAEIGIDLGEDLALYEIAARCRQYAEASAALIAVAAEIEQYKNDLIDPCASVDHLLATYEYSPATDSAERVTQLKALERKFYNYMTDHGQLEKAQGNLVEEQKRVTNLEEQIKAFYEGRGLAVGDRQRLDELLEQRPEYIRLTSEQSSKTLMLNELETELGEHAELSKLDEEELNQRLGAAEQESAKQSDVDQEIGAIEQRVKAAIEGSDAELALAEVETKRDALLEADVKARLAAAGRFLLDQVDEEHERTSRPVVLERAMQHFTAFTHNAFELTLADGDDGGFRARNTTTRELLELAQLSDGTRIQLLLAVRLAFATSAERGTSIPLMLDEALSTSDPERFAAVAEALTLLAADGRQIFYLTSNPADVAVWIGAAHQETALAPAIVDLGRIRWDQAAIKNIDDLKLPERTAVAKPDGMGPEEYAVALGVPPARVHAPIEALHLFYLLRDDLPLLYELIAKYRIDTVGKWLSFSVTGRADKLLSLQDCKRLGAICTGAREVQRAAIVGRGKPVDAQALEESGAVTGKYMPVLRDLVQVVGGNAKAILDVINDPGDDRVKGFRKKNHAELNEYFEASGYIDTSPKLEIATIYARTILAMAVEIDEGVATKDECMALADRLLGAFEA
jgi:exonuclease SbcC